MMKRKKEIKKNSFEICNNNNNNKNKNKKNRKNKMKTNSLSLFFLKHTKLLKCQSNFVGLFLKIPK